mmetsp:Transcript_25585/g.52105  ORF Transcript_25585/g.52105 Transcript_25585/m.52105 type:complete len:80 (-) Transcript_25585:28-267(-)
MFSLITTLTKLNEFQYPDKHRTSCPSDDVWAGGAPFELRGVGRPGTIVPETVPEGELWPGVPNLIRGVGDPGTLTANCA